MKEKDMKERLQRESVLSNKRKNEHDHEQEM